MKKNSLRIIDDHLLNKLVNLYTLDVRLTEEMYKSGKFRYEWYVLRIPVKEKRASFPLESFTLILECRSETESAEIRFLCLRGGCRIHSSLTATIMRL